MSLLLKMEHGRRKNGTNEKISVVQNDGKVWNALKSGIYYIEGPTKVENNYKDGPKKKQRSFLLVIVSLVLPLTSH